MGEYEDRYPESYGRGEEAQLPPEAPGDRAAYTVKPVITRPADPPTYRGIGPRGYVRRAERIYEDICDRLTDNPFIDASDIDVSVSGSQVTLTGTVDSVTALRQAEAIAADAVGVSRVRSQLRVHAAVSDQAPSPGDQVNRAMGVPPQQR